MTSIEKATELFGRKFHCSQAVFAANSRSKTNEVTDRFMAEFVKENGSYMCKELSGWKIRSCSEVTYEKNKYII